MNVSSAGTDILAAVATPGPIMHQFKAGAASARAREMTGCPRRPLGARPPARCFPRARRSRTRSTWSIPRLHQILEPRCADDPWYKDERHLLGRPGHHDSLPGSHRTLFRDVACPLLRSSSDRRNHHRDEDWSSARTNCSWPLPIVCPDLLKHGWGLSVLFGISSTPAPRPAVRERVLDASALSRSRRPARASRRRPTSRTDASSVTYTTAHNAPSSLSRCALKLSGVR